MDRGRFVIVRTFSAGVFAGYLDQRDGKDARPAFGSAFF